jgi:hypothetical protein
MEGDPAEKFSCRSCEAITQPPAKTIGPMLIKLAAEKRELEAALAGHPEAEIVALHPGAVNRYLEVVNDLAAALSRRIRSGDDPYAPLVKQLAGNTLNRGLHPHHARA